MPVGKVTTVFRDVSVLQVCKLNTNYTIKFHKRFVKKISRNVYQKTFSQANIEPVKRSVARNC